jgi:hypothetical protein
MHAVRPGSLGGLLAAGDDAAEGFVLGHLPAHRHPRGQVVADQAGPQHHAVGTRMARGDAQRKAGHVGGQRVARVGGRHAGNEGKAQEVAAVDVHRDSVPQGERRPPLSIRARPVRRTGTTQ